MTNQTCLPNGLTQKQFAFYNNLIGQMKESGKMDVKKAALSAGFSPRNYSSIVSRLLKKPEGQAYLKSLQQESTYTAVTHLDWIMEKLVRIVQAGIADDGTINTKYIKDSLRALSELSKIQGHYAPEKNFNFSMKMDDTQEARLHELMLKYERDLLMSELSRFIQKFGADYDTHTTHDV